MNTGALGFRPSAAMDSGFRRNDELPGMYVFERDKRQLVRGQNRKLVPGTNF
jgi:hypothetical protein